MTDIALVRPGMYAHASGALWLPETRSALVADVHLGYSWAQRRRGELGPLVDSHSREKLLRLQADLQPARFIFLGDLVHAPRPCPPEREWIEDTLNLLAADAKLIAVRGNHDRAFAHEFGHLRIQTLEAWSAESIVAIHGDRLTVPLPENHTLVMGHLHPSLPVRDASGAGRKVPIFLANSACVILPAFSPFAGGYDVAGGLPGELSRLFRKEEVHAFAVTGKRAVDLGSLRHTIERMNANDTSAAAQFRGRRRRRAPAPSPNSAPGGAAT